MFLHLSVIHSVQGKGCRPWDGERAPSWGVGGGRLLSLEGYMKGGGLWKWCRKGTPSGRQAGGTHLTGMLSCFDVNL